jgi:hypothetical protein
MNRRGVYEILTTFFFIMVLLIVLFLMLLLSGKVTLLQGRADEARIKSSIARETYLAFIECNKQAVLAENNIEPCRINATGARAVKVMQVAFDACEEKLWGDTEYNVATAMYNRDVFSYWAPVKQNGTEQVCMAHLLIVV